jgi:hypothetical protein
MDKVAPILYAEYGRYISRWRAIPYHIDALLPVDRRLILSLNDIARERTKSLKVVGYAIGNYHPHKEPYEPLVKLVKLGLCIGQGNFGYSGIKVEAPAAAPRYTEVSMPKWLIDLAFKYIKYANWKKYEYESEPEFLPSPIPIGLIGNDINLCGISFYKPIFPRFKPIDLVKRLKFLLKKESRAPIKPYVLNHSCKYDSDLLEKGISKMDFVTNYTKKSNTEYILHGIPMTKNNILEYCEKNNLTIKDLSSSDININISGKNIVESEFIAAITTTIHFDCIVVNNEGLVHKKSIDDIILDNYQKYKECAILSKNDKLSKLIIKLEEMKVVAEIKSIIKEYNVNELSDILKYAKSPHDIIKMVVDKYTINSLINSKLDISKIENDISNIKKEISDIDNVLYNGLSSIENISADRLILD